MTQGWTKASVGLIRFYGYQTRHLLTKSMKSLLSEFNIYAKHFDDGLRNNPFLFGFILGLFSVKNFLVRHPFSISV